MSRHNAAKTVCKWGHSLTDPSNVYVNYSRSAALRQCRQCRRDRLRASRIRTGKDRSVKYLDPAALRRLLDASNDGVSASDLQERFGLTHDQLQARLRDAMEAK